MARDYKYRANIKKKKPKQPQVAWWKWAMVFVLIFLFIYFLVFLQNSAPELKRAKSSTVSKKTKYAPKPISNKPKKSNEPRFDFYTILPETEVVVPDYEIKTRNREEQLGKGKKNQYVVQAGSFRDYSEADKLRARLALMGIESKVEKAKIGNIVWNRVKMGPFNRSSSVSVIKKRLRQNGIDVVVLEVKR